MKLTTKLKQTSLFKLSAQILILFVILGMTGTVLKNAYADVTNSGATTNTQTNTSGSNTTISGGYAAETTNTYQSGSSNNTTTNLSLIHI